MPTILIVDDNQGVRAALRMLCELHQWHTLEADSPAQALQRIGAHAVDLVIQDMNFQHDTTSGDEGVTLFQALRSAKPDVPIILLTAWTHLEHAVQLVRAGAADYLQKPWDDQKLVTTIENLLELGDTTHALRRETARSSALKKGLQQFDLRGFVYADTATAAVVQLACQVARADVPVLILGPNGAGKERIAEIIQANSSVSKGPFVTLNCGAIPAELIEAELFGTEAGAYTGAKVARAGKFEAADGGTLFLDEIGNLSLAGQIKLLRVLETGRFQRLGSNLEKQVQVRVISATNADLPALIRAGEFREDLYYRLNCIAIELPALRARPDDIPALVQHFMKQATKPLSAAASSALAAHHWPGNVRELKNTLQRASLLAQGAQIEAADLALPVVAPLTGAVHGAEEPSKADIEAAIARADGVIAQAASELGLSRQALYRRMDRFGIKREQS
jgi:DNA-binding NtrC family response regulator